MNGGTGEVPHNSFLSPSIGEGWGAVVKYTQVRLCQREAPVQLDEA